MRSVTVRLISSGIVQSPERRPASRWITGDAQLRRGERGGHRRVDVARDEHGVGRAARADPLDPDASRGRSARRGVPEPDSQEEVRAAAARAARGSDSDSTCRSAGRCAAGGSSIAPRLGERVPDGRDLDEVRSRADHDQDCARPRPAQRRGGRRASVIAHAAAGPGAPVRARSRSSSCPIPRRGPGRCSCAPRWSLISPGTEQAIAAPRRGRWSARRSSGPTRRARSSTRRCATASGRRSPPCDARLDDLMTPGLLAAPAWSRRRRGRRGARGSATASRCVGANAACHAELVVVPAPAVHPLPAGSTHALGCVRRARRDRGARRPRRRRGGRRGRGGRSASGSSASSPRSSPRPAARGSSRSTRAPSACGSRSSSAPAAGAVAASDDGRGGRARAAAAPARTP